MQKKPTRSKISVKNGPIPILEKERKVSEKYVQHYNVICIIFMNYKTYIYIYVHIFECDTCKTK